MINDVNISKDFKLSEFESPDTKEVKVDPKLVQLLQKLRDKIGQPLVITSGYRTWEHHVAIYQKDYGPDWEKHVTKKSQHLTGKAADIKKVSGLTVDEMAVLSSQAGFDGIGKYNWGIHVDTRGYNARWDWR